MNFYIAFQDDTEDKVEKRAYLEENIKAIMDGLAFPKSTDRITWEVENAAHLHIHEDIQIALNYILKPEAPKPNYIPHISQSGWPTRVLNSPIRTFTDTVNFNV